LANYIFQYNLNKHLYSESYLNRNPWQNR